MAGAGSGAYKLRKEKDQELNSREDQFLKKKLKERNKGTQRQNNLRITD